MNKSSVVITVNGERRSVSAQPERMLLSVLREDLGLSGAKYGCGEGQCGACTVLVEGEPVRSCVTPFASVADKKITTIEGLEKNGKLHPLQQAMMDENAMQCGYCTAGVIMSGVALLNHTPAPTDNQIVNAMTGNVCRCGTYKRIIAAVKRASIAMKGTKR